MTGQVGKGILAVKCLQVLSADTGLLHKADRKLTNSNQMKWGYEPSDKTCLPSPEVDYV